MMKKLTTLLMLAVMMLSLAACGGLNKEPQAAAPATTAAPETQAPEQTEAPTEAEAPTETAAEDGKLADGVYSVDFNTDSGMFHVNEALEGKGTLTVENGRMTVHITLVSKSILNLFPGSAEDAKKDGAQLLEPTEDPVTYSDGYQETVYGFDVPVEEIGVDFPLAIIGKKGTWYDHTVSVTNPEPIN